MERTVSFYVFHPCYFLEEALKSFLRCLGLETRAGRSETNTGSQKKEEEEEIKPAAACAIGTPQISSSTPQKSSQDPPTSTILNESLTGRRGPRRPGLSTGDPGQHN